MAFSSLLIVFLQEGSAKIAETYSLSTSISDIVTGIVLFFIISAVLEVRTRARYKNHEKSPDDWDLFDDESEEARKIVESPYMFHTYTYATENYLCYAPSLHNVCVKATKNDSHIFDFEGFMACYSRTIYPIFLWYAYSAQLSHESVFPLAEFKNTVRLGYLEVERNGADTLAWLCRQVQHRKAYQYRI